MNRETTTARAGNTLVKHPEDYPKRPWRTISFDYVRGGQPRPYADTLDEFLITFEGGSPSTREGWDLPFGTKPGPELAKQVLRPLIVHQWRTDDTLGEPRNTGGPWLTEFEVAEQEDTHTTYRAVVVTPFMD